MHLMEPFRIDGPWGRTAAMILVFALAASCEADGRKAGAADPAPAIEKERSTSTPAPAAATADPQGRPTPAELEAPVGCELSCATKLAYEEKDVIAQPGAKIGDFTRCPVSGAVFVVSDRSSRRQVDGKDVFVCCESCAQRFQLDPAFFMARASRTKGG